MNIIEIVEVIRSGLDPDLYLGGNVDIPTTNTLLDEYNLEIAGWCVPKNNVPLKIEVLYDGGLQVETEMNVVRPDVIAHFAPQQIPEKSGFSLIIKTLHLAPNFELTVNLVSPEDGRTNWATIKGTQIPVAPDFKPGIQPVMIYGPGRSGSTWLMNLLGLHPEIVIDPHHPYEVFSMTYWLHLARVLAAPADLENSAHSDETYFTTPYWVGSNPYNRSPIVDQTEVKNWFRQEYVNELFAFSLQSIENFNRKLAIAQDKPNTRYFAEKYLIGPGIDWVPQLVWQLYPNTKEIFLIRDFRDWFCSIRSFNLKRGFNEFDYQNERKNEWEFIELVRNRSTWLLANWQQRKNKAFLLRYEDLVRQPQENLVEVFKYLELEATPAFIEEILQRTSGNSLELQQHKTSKDLNSSVGRWKQDLNPDLQEILNREFAEILTGFGYEV